MSLRFIRYARPAVAAAISQAAGAPQARIRATVDTSLRMTTTGEDGGTAAWTAPGATLAVLGPADAVGLAADQILARVPAPDATAVSPTQFASIEFQRPDLPWLFTPYAPGRDDTLPPWLCLVAVPATGAEILPSPHGALVRLDPSASARLPDPARAAEWAHVQEGDAAPGAGRDAVIAGARETPRRFRSRLLCPMALRENTEYLACLVPTFLGGRLAGLGETLDLDDPALLGPAWTVGQAVDLPVYDHWRFSTGAADRFADLVAQLEAYDPSSAPGRSLDAGTPEGGDSPIFADAVLGMDAAMGPAGRSTPPAALVGHLAARLADPSPLAPPVYGGRHARAPVPPGTGAPAWVRTLNLDPVRRVAAGLGAEVVRRHQEEMMAAIWEQAGEIDRANQLLRLGQSARAAATALFLRRLAPDLQRGRDGDDLGALLWLAPMLGHLPLAPRGLTAATELVRSCLPRLATSGAFRKLVRPNGPILRRLRRRHDDQPQGADLLLRLADGGGRRPTPAAPEATTLSAAELGSLGVPGGFPGRRLPGDRFRIDPGVLDPRINRPVLIDPRIGPRLPGRTTTTATTAPASLEAARALAARWAKPRAGGCRPLGHAGGGDREALFEGLRAAADPAFTIARRTRARIGTDPRSPALATPTADTLDPILLAPTLPWPMLRPLLALDRAWMAPALQARGAPEQYIALIDANPAFIESYMAGLNEEIGREMLWRGFPTDQRGTVFDRFWSDARAEWPGLDTWTGPLGGHALTGATPRMVVAVRGTLLQRFDRAAIFLQKASTTVPPAPLPDLGGAQSTLYPLVDLRLPGNIACFGFDLTAEEAIGGGRHGPGWYLVFQEPPVDLRFGPAGNTPSGQQVTGDGSSDRFAETALRPQQRVYIHAATLLGRP